MKILYVANIHRHFNAFHVPYIKMLKEEGHTVHAAANGDEKVPYLDKQFNIPIQRSPYNIKNITAYRKLTDIIRSEKYDLVHCHTPMGGIISRLASRNEDSKVLYTSHGFHFCKGAPLINWLLYYPVERFMARYTDAIVTINNEDNKRAQSFNIKKRYNISGIGINISEVSKESSIKNSINKRRDINLTADDILITSVGDLTKRKNHEVIIRAISKLNNKRIRYVICGTGELEFYLKKLCHKLKVEEQVLFLGYRKDIGELLGITDIFAFPSLWEGLGMAGIEAMVAGVPVIASNRHGIKDYAIHNETALLCTPTKVDDFVKAMNRIMNEKELESKLTMNAFEKVKQFDIENSLSQMKKIYNDIL